MRGTKFTGRMRLAICIQEWSKQYNTEENNNKNNNKKRQVEKMQANTHHLYRAVTGKKLTI